MSLSTNQFVEGIDPTGTFGGFTSVLLQLIRQATPADSYGMVIYDNTFPDVSGSNAWRKRCILIYTLDPTKPQIYLYRASGSPGWINFFDLLPDDVITTAMIQDHAVTIDKLGADGGSAGQLIRVNPGATGFEFVSLSALFGPGTLNVNVINASSVGSGQLRLVGAQGLVANTSFITPDQIVGAVTNNTMLVSKLRVATVLSAKSQFISCRTLDGNPIWREFDPDIDLSNNILDGVKLETNTVPPAKLIAGTNGQVLTMVAGVPAWAATGTARNLFRVANGAVPTVTGISNGYIIAHGLAGAPQSYTVDLICTAPDTVGGVNYVAGDVVPYNDNRLWGSAGDNEFAYYSVKVDATNFNVWLYSTGVTTPANWRIRIFAEYFV